MQVVRRCFACRPPVELVVNVGTESRQRIVYQRFLDPLIVDCAGLATTLAEHQHRDGAYLKRATVWGSPPVHLSMQDFQRLQRFSYVSRISPHRWMQSTAQFRYDERPNRHCTALGVGRSLMLLDESYIFPTSQQKGPVIQK